MFLTFLSPRETPSMKDASQMTNKKTQTLLMTFLVALTLFDLTACGRTPGHSHLEVSDVAHTPVKRQSIGNCWLYATSTWAESLHLSATSETVNLSESYWTYWDWYHKLVGSHGTEINTSGGWTGASRIIASHGFMYEADFLPEEAESEMSNIQHTAEAAINEVLKNGALKDPQNRTPKNVRAALDSAFGVNMEDLAGKVHQASDLVTTVINNNRKFTLADEIAGGMHQWTVLNYPRLSGQNAREPLLVRRRRAHALQRALRAVNDKRPVIMSSMVEFSALNTENSATFEYELYLRKGYSSGQGGHLVVLEDYVAENVPGIGHIGEGEVTPEQKEAALRGDVSYLVVKNSWGTERPDRGLSDGYTRFTMDFLNRPLPFNLEDGDSDISHGTWYSALSAFILPPEY